jgi:hypothetical protein
VGDTNVEGLVSIRTGSTFEGPTEMLGGPGEDMLSETDNTFLGTFFEDFEL